MSFDDSREFRGLGDIECDNFDESLLADGDGDGDGYMDWDLLTDEEKERETKLN